MAADRAPYIDQSQSMNIFIENLTLSKFSSLHIYAWKKGLKTGSYYIRSKPAANSQSFTIDPNKVKQIQSQERNTYEPCLTCSS